MDLGNGFQLLLRTILGLLPVCLFLVSLIYLDSYKLVRFKMVVRAVVAGCLAALAAYVVNRFMIDSYPQSSALVIRITAPIIEEFLKGLFIIALIRMRKIGFLVDAAILGFAAGAGFALVENLYYLGALAETPVTLWVIRGLGTAIMHGGATSIFAIMSKSLTQHLDRPRFRSFLPGFGAAVVIHAVFNHFLISPMLSTLLVVLVLPPALNIIFARSEQHLQRWLGSGFDLDNELLRVINSGEFTTSPVGLYLKFLKQYFSGEVLADMLCYLRLNTELGLRAKGILMMREHGFAVKPDEGIREGIAELKYLEKTIGKTGMMSLTPMLRSGEQDMWQLRLLEGL